MSVYWPTCTHISTFIFGSTSQPHTFEKLGVYTGSSLYSSTARLRPAFSTSSFGSSSSDKEKPVSLYPQYIYLFIQTCCTSNVASELLTLPGKTHLLTRMQCLPTILLAFCLTVSSQNTVFQSYVGQLLSPTQFTVVALHLHPCFIHSSQAAFQLGFFPQSGWVFS